MGKVEQEDVVVNDLEHVVDDMEGMDYMEGVQDVEEGGDYQYSLDDDEEDSSTSSVSLTPSPKKASNKALITKFFDFLKSDSELNTVLAGYFCRIFLSIFSTNTKKVLWYLYVKKSEVIDDLKRHLYLQSIAEVVSKLIAYTKSDMLKDKYEE